MGHSTRALIIYAFARLGLRWHNLGGTGPSYQHKIRDGRRKWKAVCCKWTYLHPFFFMMLPSTISALQQKPRWLSD